MKQELLQLTEEQKEKLESLWGWRDMNGYRSLIWKLAEDIFLVEEGRDVITSSMLDNEGRLAITIDGIEAVRTDTMKDTIELESKQ